MRNELIQILDGSSGRGAIPLLRIAVECRVTQRSIQLGRASALSAVERFDQIIVIVPPKPRITRLRTDPTYVHQNLSPRVRDLPNHRENNPHIERHLGEVMVQGNDARTITVGATLPGEAACRAQHLARASVSAQFGQLG